MDIFNAVRSGDTTKVVYLVEEQHVSLQQRDDWDATPLYYASFTGNQELVKYLLGKGATCEEKTFDGERCLYAALNNTVRELLLEQGFKRAGARRHDLYLEFLEKLLDDSQQFADIAFQTSQQCKIEAHRFMLAARCPALRQFIDSAWSANRMVEDFGSLDATAVLAIITWCYTCRLQVPADSANSCQDLLAYLQLQGLANHLMEERSALAGKASLIIVEPGREEAKADLQDAMSRTAKACMSGKDTDEIYHDLILLTEGEHFRAHKAILCARSQYFSVLLTNPNFKEGQLNARLAEEGSFGLKGEIQQLQLDFAAPEIVATALHWMYTDQVTRDLPAEHLLENNPICQAKYQTRFQVFQLAMERLINCRYYRQSWLESGAANSLALQVLRFSEVLLCEGLKSKCALLLQPYITTITAIPYLTEAIRVEAERLANACLRVIAQNLKEVVHDPQFSELVRESAASVEERQDVDSVPIIDDIRFFITQLHGEDDMSDNDAHWDDEGNIICSDLEEDFEKLSEKNQKFYLLQNLLARLGYEA